MNAGDDGGGDGGWHPQAEPIHHLKAGQPGLGHGRHLRHAGPAAGAGEGDGAQPAGLDMLLGDLRADEEHIDAAGEKVGHRLGHAAIGHGEDIGAGHALHDFGGDMAGGAIAGIAIGQPARLAPGEGQDFRQGGHGH